MGWHGELVKAGDTYYLLPRGRQGNPVIKIERPRDLPSIVQHLLGDKDKDPKRYTVATAFQKFMLVRDVFIHQVDTPGLDPSRCYAVPWPATFVPSPRRTKEYRDKARWELSHLWPYLPSPKLWQPFRHREESMREFERTFYEQFDRGRPRLS